MKILIAQHRDFDQQLIRGELSVLGHELEFSANGDDAWRRLLAGRYSVVIVDQEMPGLNALEICRRLRTQASGSLVHVVVLSNDGSQESVLAALTAGANECLLNPVDPVELGLRIKTAVERMRAYRESVDRATQSEPSLEKSKRLAGLLSVCAHCKSIRNLQHEWQRLEDFITQHTDAVCSHGICPTCADSFRAGAI